MKESKKLEILGRNIRVERVRAGLTQEELAERIDINCKHLGAIERGKINPRFLTLLAIIEEFKISFNDLYN